MKLIILLALFVNSQEIVNQPKQQENKPKLSWEQKNPQNKEWTKITLDKIEENFNKFDSAQDVEQICPNYKNLEREDKKWVWGELISTMSWYESGWKPIARMEEPSLGVDVVTGGTVTSEGLMQMSYGDTKWATWCQYDWKKDKNLPPNSSKKTILQPKNNLECGIQVLANQIGRTKKLFLGKGAYWSVIKINNKHRKIEQIKAKIRELGICHIEEKEC